MIKVVKRNGRVEPLDIKKIQKYTSASVKDLNNVNQSELELDAHIQFRDNISTREIQETLIKTAVEKIDVDRPDWTFVAARLFLYDLYHKVSGFTGYTHLRDYLKKAEKEGRIVKGLKEKYNLDELNDYIKPQRDLQFNYLGVKTLYDRYLIKDSQNRPIELPQHMFMAIAMFLAQNEFNSTDWAKRFYDLISKFEVMLATPTLSNARTPRHQLSSCFPKGERVLTYNGYKNIEDIEVGDFVLTHKNRFKRVYELLNRDYDSTLYSFKIAGIAQNLQCTKEHPLLTIAKEEIDCIRKGKLCLLNQKKYKECFALKGQYKNDCELLEKDFSALPKWIEAKDIKEGDFLQVSFPTFSHQEKEILVSDYITLKNIEIVKEKICIKRESCGYEYYSRTYYNNQINPITNKIPLNDDFFRLIGYYLAEGYSAKDLSSVSFTFSKKETYYIQDTIDIVKNLFDLTASIKENRDNSTTISIHNTLFSNFIYSLVGSGFDKKYLNDILMYAKNQLHLLVGTFRGDACVVENGIILSLSNEELIKQLYNIALREGLTPKIRVPKPSHLATTKPFMLEINYLNDKEFIELVGKNLEKISVNRHNKNGIKVGRAINQFWFNNNFYVKIKKITNKNINEKVYNLEVEDDHSYVVNSIAVHNCYIGSTPDNIEGIFDSYKEMALLSKYGGGIGWDWNQVRGMGGQIAGHKNAAGGTVPFLKITNDIAIAVDQLGTRKGAIAVYLEPWHIDIYDFLDLRKNSGEERRRAHDLFPAVWLNDLFMQRVEQNSVWTLFDPYEVPNLSSLYGKEFEEKYLEYETREDITKEIINAKELWKKILINYFETGSPFLTFKDTANRANPNSHYGVIRSSNLCVTGDTRLHTQFGLIKAKELEESYKEILATYDYRTDGNFEDKGVGVANALKMFKTKENADVYEIITKDGYKIKSTLWHEYYTASKNKNSFCVEKKQLKEIKIGDNLLIQSAKGQFGREGSYDLGFLIGMVTGDGTFSEKKEKNYSIVHIDLYNDDIKLGKSIHKQIENIINKYYSFLPKAHKKEFKNLYPKEIKHSENSKKIRFSNIRLGRIFDEQFNFNKNNKLKVPEIIFKSKEDCVKGYLQGLFIADATINKIKNNKIPTFAIQLASISEKLLEGVQILLANFGIFSKISKMRDKEEDVFSYKTVDNIKKTYDSSPLYRLNINGNNAIKFIYEIGFIGSKQEKALSILEDREKLGYSIHSRKNEKFIATIKEINYIGKEDVYDTTQTYNHSLIFNGIVTGNCTEIFQNTNPNKYKVKVEFEDESIKLYDEFEYVTIENGIVKEAKDITALDSIDNKRVYIVEKEKIDGNTAVCNLASINLSKVNTKEDIERVVPIAIRMLDNVIDLNFYPLRKVKDTNVESRAIGLGVMGEAQMLVTNQIEWGSEEHFTKIDEIMEAVSYNAIKASSSLAIEKGKYPKFENSDWSRGVFPIDKANENAKALVTRGGIFGYEYDWIKLKEKVKRDGMRNGYLMAIAPTSSISILVGTTQAIEPVYKRKWFEENLSGLIPVVVPNLTTDTWSYYQSAYELDQRVLIKAAAIRQKWIDQGQSLNIFMTLDKASGKYLNEIYMLGWKLGLKSTYYLRSQSPESVKEEDIADRSMECLGCQ